jgi:hypothetical protein
MTSANTLNRYKEKKIAMHYPRSHSRLGAQVLKLDHDQNQKVGEGGSAFQERQNGFFIEHFSFAMTRQEIYAPKPIEGEGEVHGQKEKKTKILSIHAQFALIFTYPKKRVLSRPQRNGACALCFVQG